MTLLSPFLLQMRYGFGEIEEKAKYYVDVKEYKAATQRTKRRKRFLRATASMLSAHYAIAIPSVRPSVCLSVCHTGDSWKNGCS